jgi:hypothetical protein
MEVFCHFGAGGLVRASCYGYLSLKVAANGSKLLVHLH